MRAVAWLTLLTLSSCADVLGIEDAYFSDFDDTTLPDSGALPGDTGAGSGGTNHDGSSDEDDSSHGSAGVTTSEGSAGAAASPDEPPDDGEPELPPDDGHGGVAGATSAGGSGGSTGGGGGTSGSGGSATGGSTGEEPPTLSCQSYCASVLTNCTGQYAQYRNEQECLAVCALLPLGSPLSLSGNSVACRHSEATLAALAPAAHCKNAGPAGNGQCGETCDGYCAIVLSACKAPSKHSFANLAKCSELCLERTNLGNYGVDPKLGYESGETQQCLLFHATAATATPGKECESAVGDGKCEEDD